jgi:hypothetical protein
MQQVRQCVLIADDLVAQFQSVVGRMAKAASQQDDSEVPVLRAEGERLYGAIWEHLDDAAQKTHAAGRPTEDYATLRSAPGLNAAVGVSDVRSDVIGITAGFRKDIVHVQATVTMNAQGIDLARRASTALKAAWPEIDWTPAPPTPDVDLRPRGLLSRLFGRR